VDANEQKDFIHFLAKELKIYSRELMAYQLFAHLLKQAGIAGVDEILNQARQSPALEARFEKNFEGFDALIPPADPDQSERVRELLERWKPKGGEPN
jgi:hypothetical protein